MSTARIAVVTPVYGEAYEKSGLFELKPLQSTVENHANKHVVHEAARKTSRSRLSDDRSLEEQTGFFGRW